MKRETDPPGPDLLLPPPADVKGAVVLLVDDERAWRKSVGLDLAMLGYRPLLAEDAAEALELAAQETPEAAIVDIMLPEPMHGWELGLELRRRGLATALIFYSAYLVFDTLPPISNVIGYVPKGSARAQLYGLIPSAVRMTRGGLGEDAG